MRFSRIFFLLRTLLFPAFLFGIAASVAVADETKTEPRFSNQTIQSDAKRYETYLRANWKPGETRAAVYVARGNRLLKSNARGASREFAAAVVADKDSAVAWIGLAKSLLAIDTSRSRGSERYDIPVNASGAAYLAYQRAGTAERKAQALSVLSTALQRRSFWRPAIEALKTSLALKDDAGVRASLTALKAQHGFRMVNYEAQSETLKPRICVEFSEGLAKAVTEFSKYISIDGEDPQGVTAEGRKLCVDGLAHGQRYEMLIRAGLPAEIGEMLEKDVELAVYLPDRKPNVRFTGRAYVLPSTGQQGIPVVSVNTDNVDIEVYRIGDRALAEHLRNGELGQQLSRWDLNRMRQATGEKVYSGVLAVKRKLNADTTTAFPVSEAIGTLKPGAYLLAARPSTGNKKHDDQVATQWFIVSDLGLTAFSGDDGVHGFVRSLETSKPVADAQVRLIARNNEVLAKATTDASGYVKFAGGLQRGEGGLQPAMLVAERNGADYAFLDLTNSAFDLSDRGVKGRAAPGPIDGYIYTERGVYRPGEDAYVTALVRDNAGKAAALPVTLVVVRPDGVEHTRVPLVDQGLGGRETILSLSNSAMTGTWRTKLHTDPNKKPIAEASFLVEDFVPERLDMTLSAGDGVIAPKAPVSIAAEGRFLYGPPADNLAIEGDIIVKPSRKGLSGFKGYLFGVHDEIVTPVREPLGDLAQTDGEGKATVQVSLPKVTKTQKPLEASVLLRLRESGGRTIERRITVPVDLGLERIGIKPQFDDLALDEDTDAEFDIIALDKKGQQVAKSGLDWTLYRIDTTWQWYARNGNWSYEAIELRRKVSDGKLDTAKDAGATLKVPVKYGRYELEVADADADGAVSSIGFNAGWYTGGETAESPEMLDVALDKERYKVGETAKLRIATKRAGTALIAVLGNGLFDMVQAEIPAGGGDVDITVGADWGPGAYATAMFYRPMDGTQKRMPGRAVGVRWIGIDQSPRTLDVSLDVPEKVKSGSTLTVPVTISGLNSGEKAHVTIAAVDIGILNLTRFKSPAPETWFYAQRRLATEIRDFYGRLIDGMRAERGALRSGGDGDGGLSMQGSPPVEETVALYSGIVSVDSDGKAAVTFDMPDFNGSVRVMAVAWSADKLGHAARAVIVRDRVALTVAGPRFLTLGDTVRMALDVHNVDGPDDIYNVIADQQAGEGPRATVLTRSVKLAAGERRTERFEVKPSGIGLHIFDVRVSGPEGIDVKRRLTFDVKPPAGDIRRTTVSKLKPGAHITVSRALAHDLIDELARINVSVGPAARLDVPTLLTQLDRYPYGCVEQTVSRALPLVYANAVAADAGLASDKALKARVQEAVNRVFEMQDSSGAFGAWGPAYTNIWLTSYVTDFLTRAKEAGYAVNPLGFTQALDRLQNYISYAGDFEKGGEDRAYALYVLARNGRAPAGELRYYADARLKRFSTPIAKAQLGAALAMIGDKPRAERAFASSIADLNQSSQSLLARSDYGSVLRDGAALVALTTETGVARDQSVRLVDVVATAYENSTRTSTQEQAWMLLAANALADQAKTTSVLVDGQSQTGPLRRSLRLADLGDDGLRITNTGEDEVDAVISVYGSSLTPEPELASGYTITRSYYKLDGTQVELESATGGTSTVNQNDRLVVVLKVVSEHEGGRPLIVDRLPAGLQIENPRLVDSGDIKSLPWLKSPVSARHAEFKDDRFVAAFDLYPTSRRDKIKPAGTEMTAAYIVRAVTPGAFVHPAATVEDMYRPERHARTGSGTLTVVGKE